MCCWYVYTRIISTWPFMVHFSTLHISWRSLGHRSCTCYDNYMHSGFSINFHRFVRILELKQHLDIPHTYEYLHAYNYRRYTNISNIYQSSQAGCRLRTDARHPSDRETVVSHCECKCGLEIQIGLYHLVKINLFYHIDIRNNLFGTITWTKSLIWCCRSSMAIMFWWNTGNIIKG